MHRRFGNSFSSRLAPICVVKYWDKNDNGRQDKGEPPLPGRNFVLRDSATHRIIRTLKSGRGNTCSSVLPGNYTVSELPDTGSVPTLPTTSSQNATVAVGLTQILKFATTVQPGQQERGEGQAGGGPSGLLRDLRR